MALTAGTRLGTYEIAALIGAGGMGEVYRARDTRLNRDVALKVLPELFAADPERLARFKREAQLLASLNHPNIAAIYGFEEGPAEAGHYAGSTHALVLELVEGPTLADRIAQGPIPLDEALPIARQIAEALEAAHERGIIHRDLKPANIKVRPDGTVKVLDFGLAKAFEGDPVASSSLSMSPTITSPAATRMGTILGTAAYMSPEQARGRPVDKRTDIWAFGCVLYEMLTGRSAFGGEDVSLTLSQILQRDADWSALPAGLSASARRTLMSCLQKDPAQRLRDFGDVRLMLAADEYIAFPPPRSMARPYRWLAAGALAGAAAYGVLLWALTTTAGGPAQPIRFAIAPPPGVQLGRFGAPDLALSPDGRTLVFVGGTPVVTQLYRRDMQSLEISPIRGTEGAMQPFFSPDGRSIGFFTDRSLSKIALDGGLPTPVTEIADFPGGGTWGADDTIFFTLGTSPELFRVAASGGPYESIRVDTGSGAEAYYSSPHVLPGGRAIAAAARVPKAVEPDVVVISLDTGAIVSLGPGAAPKYAATGHLLYWHGNAIWGVPFDAARLRPGGAAAALVAGVERLEGIAPFAVAGDGTLVYVQGSREAELTWVDGRGGITRALQESGPYVDPSLSPDGRNLAFARQESNQDIWVFDLVRDTATKLTSQPGLDMAPIWNGAGTHVTYTEESGGEFALVTTAVGRRAPERLLAGRNLLFPSSWSTDGQWLAYVERSPQTNWDIWLLDSERRPHPFEQTPFDETDPAISPNGRLIAYTSNETGQREIYLDSFPRRGAKRSISRAGGTWPVWSRAGDRLFYQTATHVVSVALGPDGEFGPPQPLFPSAVVGGFMRPYDVAPDGRRFIALNQKSEARFEVVLHWFDELTQLVPSD